MTEHEVKLQRVILSMQARLLRQGKITRTDMRLSCLWATDTEFQRLLDAIVAGGIATRHTGRKGGEHYINAMGGPRAKQITHS